MELCPVSHSDMLSTHDRWPVVKYVSATIPSHLRESTRRRRMMMMDRQLTASHIQPLACLAPIFCLSEQTKKVEAGCLFCVFFGGGWYWTYTKYTCLKPQQPMVHRLLLLLCEKSPVGCDGYRTLAQQTIGKPLNACETDGDKIFQSIYIQ